jgi:hypothetical protein
MARKWSGFLAQNSVAKEEWNLIEACEHWARATQGNQKPDHLRQNHKQHILSRILKPK